MADKYKSNWRHQRKLAYEKSEPQRAWQRGVNLINASCFLHYGVRADDRAWEDLGLSVYPKDVLFTFQIRRVKNDKAT